MRIRPFSSFPLPTTPYPANWAGSQTSHSQSQHLCTIPPPNSLLPSFLYPSHARQVDRLVAGPQPAAGPLQAHAHYPYTPGALAVCSSQLNGAVGRPDFRLRRRLDIDTFGTARPVLRRAVSRTSSAPRTLPALRSRQGERLPVPPAAISQSWFMVRTHPIPSPLLADPTLPGSSTSNG